MCPFRDAVLLKCGFGISLAWERRSSASTLQLSGVEELIPHAVLSVLVAGLDEATLLLWEIGVKR